MRQVFVAASQTDEQHGVVALHAAPSATQLAPPLGSWQVPFVQAPAQHGVAPEAVEHAAPVERHAAAT